MKLIDYKKIDLNIKALRKTNNISLVLKNDAYGFKMKKIIPIAIDNNINTFYVNTISEAIEARNICDKRIILLGPSREHIFNTIKYNIIPSAINLDDYIFYSRSHLKFALEIDCGMNRFGIKNYNENLFDNNYLEEVYVHFFKESSKNIEMINIISSYCIKYNKSYTFGGSLIYNSTTHPIRVGRLIYEDSFGLYGSVLEIKKVYKNESIGYDSEYLCDNDLLIGIVDVGYFNGLKVDYKGYVYINNNYYNLVGRVCMNHSFVVIDNKVKIGDLVEYFGKNIKHEDFIKNNNMTKYESFLYIK